MNPKVRRVSARLYTFAEFVLTAMLAAMFFAFLFQIAARYLLNWPTGWTNELSAVLWIWIVLWGGSFVITEREEMRFDLLYASAGPRVRSVMFIVSALALIVIYAMSFPAVVSYVTFMKVESTAYMKLRFDWVYSIYLVFVVAIIARYLWLCLNVFRGDAPEEYDPTKAGSGV